MAVARFFDRAANAVGRHLQIRRDDLASLIGSKPVEVVVGSSAGRADLWTADLLVNLLARLYPELRLVGADELVEPLRARARSINPNIGLDATVEPAVSIGVGVARDTACTLFAGSSGWVMQVGPEPFGPSDHGNPYAAAAAAAVAASEAFRRVFDVGGSEQRNLSVSLLDYDGGGSAEELALQNLGSVAFAGIGAVGNAALWCLARQHSLTGRLALIDDQTVELSNLQRYVLTADSSIEASKVRLGAAEFKRMGSLVEVDPVAMRLEDYSDAQGGRLMQETLCVALDSADGRRNAQALLPRLLVNGWTSDTGLGASWHAFDTSACAGCLYHPSGPAPSQVDLVAEALGLPRPRVLQMWVLGDPVSDADLDLVSHYLGVDVAQLSSWRGQPLQQMYPALVCGTVAFDVRKAGRAEAVPLAHQSALAGVLLAAELVKRSSAELSARSQPQPLLAWDEILAEPHGRWPRAVARRDECFCSDPLYLAVFREKYPVT